MFLMVWIKPIIAHCGPPFMWNVPAEVAQASTGTQGGEAQGQVWVPSSSRALQCLSSAASNGV